MQGYKKSNPQSSYIKAGVLLAVVVILFIVSQRLSTGKLPGADMTKLQLGLAKLNSMQLYSETKKDSVRKAVAGLWMTAPESRALTGMIDLDDRIEMKDNGIIWQVKTYTVALPSGDTSRYSYIMTGYLLPFGQRLAADSTAYSDVRVIYQVMIKDKDTCYGESNIMTGWSHAPRKAADSIMMFEGTKYRLYSGDVTRFFPAGAVNLAKKLSLNPCKIDYTFFESLERRIAGAFEMKTGATRDTAEIHSIVTNYYAPLVKLAVAAQFSIGDIEKTRDIAISFTVKPDGTVAKSSVVKNLPGIFAIERFVANAALLWKFPAAQQGKDVTIIYKHHQ
jgi:hypothetical protein